MAKPSARAGAKTGGTPLISVIISVYNTAPYLPQCLESIICQTYKNLEIIVIEDGSTDSSGKICEEYACRDRRISVKHRPHGGLSAGRNFGLKLARGEYVHFMDSDDYIDLDFYEAMLAAAASTGADMAVCGFESEKWDASIRYSRPQILVGAREKIEGIGGLCYRSMVWRYLFRREFFARTGLSFEEGRFYEDMIFTPQALFAANRVAVAPRVLYYYKSREGAITNRVSRHGRARAADYRRANRFLAEMDARLKLGGLLTRNMVRRRSMTSYKLFGLITILKRRSYLRWDTYYLFGIPVWKVK